MEFDPDERNIVQAGHFVPKANLPECCVMPIYRSLVEKLTSDHVLHPVPGPDLSNWPVTINTLTFQDQPVVVVYPRIGAPLAVSILEMMIEMGCRKFVALGGAGVLRSDIPRGSIVIPDSALRDEGTSYHYQPASRYIETDPEIVKKLEAVLQRHQMKYLVGRTWTTDAIFRETKKKIRGRIAENCLTVEMECASFLAAARFRKVKFGQYLEASDDVCGEEWDRRELSIDEKMAIREKLFWLSVEAVVSL